MRPLRNLAEPTPLPPSQARGVAGGKQVDFKTFDLDGNSITSRARVTGAREVTFDIVSTGPLAPKSVYAYRNVPSDGGWGSFDAPDMEMSPEWRRPDGKYQRSVVTTIDDIPVDIAQIMVGFENDKRLDGWYPNGAGVDVVLDFKANKIVPNPIGWGNSASAVLEATGIEHTEGNLLGGPLLSISETPGASL